MSWRELNPKYSEVGNEDVKEAQIMSADNFIKFGWEGKEKKITREGVE